jgi:microcystin-dependent protein
MDEYLGIIKLFAGNFAPRGWAYCDGRLMSIAQNSALFSILGTSYGGDGMTTFALPDMRVRDSSNPLGGTNWVGIEGMPQMGYIICLEGIFPSRN